MKWIVETNTDERQTAPRCWGDPSARPQERPLHHGDSTDDARARRRLHDALRHQGPRSRPHAVHHAAAAGHRHGRFLRELGPHAAPSRRPVELHQRSGRGDNLHRTFGPPQRLVPSFADAADRHLHGPGRQERRPGSAGDAHGSVRLAERTAALPADRTRSGAGPAAAGQPYLPATHCLGRPAAEFPLHHRHSPRGGRLP